MWVSSHNPWHLSRCHAIPLTTRKCFSGLDFRYLEHIEGDIADSLPRIFVIEFHCAVHTLPVAKIVWFFQSITCIYISHIIYLRLHMNTHIHTSMYIYIFPVKFCEFVVSFCWVGVCTQSPKSFRVRNLKVLSLGVPKHHHYWLFIRECVGMFFPLRLYFHQTLKEAACLVGNRQCIHPSPGPWCKMFV